MGGGCTGSWRDIDMEKITKIIVYTSFLEPKTILSSSECPEHCVEVLWREPGTAQWTSILADVDISDVVGEQKSGSGRFRGRHFGVGVEVGFLTSGFFGFGYFPLGESGFGVFKFL